MLKVIVDATPITTKPTGVGFHITNLINCLAKEQERIGFKLGIFYQPTLKKWLNRDFSLPRFINTERLEEKIIFPYPVRLSNWFLGNVPQIFPWLLDNKLQSYDIFHGTNFCVYPNSQTARVMNLYDLAFLCYPQFVDSVAGQYQQRVEQCLPWTDLIIVSSKSTKQDLIKYLRLSPEKVWVTPLASRYNQEYLQGINLTQVKQSLNYDFSQPYLLFVSTIEPRKNILTLIKAFNYLKQKYNIEQNLILVGRKGWQYRPVFEAIEQSPYSKHIYHLDYLCDRSVATFYKCATAFIYPSYYEGFGLPVLEAMTLGTPVVCANTSSLPEVAGDAALLIEPEKPGELAEAIYKIIDSSILRELLIERGYKQAAKFSWAATAQKTIEAYSAINRT